MASEDGGGPRQLRRGLVWGGTHLEPEERYTQTAVEGSGLDARKEATPPEQQGVYEPHRSSGKCDART
ncbi:hypothetical protein NDU88_004395 [Pleurodeles waltl]|uniref:Uncharacterized protein n=1 Tax=Pleurodeles waltl TaxID=8319 RepID=A0AAV7UH04_PLEWA|nr:hypothetical protein NDU88_004395 [Pleurodeles waltl]